MTAPRLPECFHEADEETLPRLGLRRFINLGGGLASNPISSSNHPVFPFPVSSGDAIDCDGPYKAEKLGKNAGDRAILPPAWEESWRDISCLTGGKLEESLKKVPIFP
ncbi:MAG: hypothetical protein WA322_00615 [Pseudolabrys sp.]